MRIMSTTKNTPEVQRVSQPAQLFIGLMGLSGAVVVGWVARLPIETQAAGLEWQHVGELAVHSPGSRNSERL